VWGVGIGDSKALSRKALSREEGIGDSKALSREEAR